MIPARSPSHVGAVVVLFRPSHTEAPCAPGRVLQVVEGSDLVSVVYDELTGGRVLAGQLCGRVRVIERPPIDNADAWQKLRDDIERSGVPVCWDQDDEGMASLEVELDDGEPPVADDLLQTDPTMPDSFDIIATLEALQSVLGANPDGTSEERAAALANVLRTFPAPIVATLRRFLDVVSAALPQVS